MADIASLIVRVKGEGVDKTNRELGSLSGVATKAAGTIAAVSAATIAAAGAMTAMVVSSAKSERELSNLSRTAKTTREDFAALSFVFKQYNVDAKGTADAMNDVSERLGEFAAAGTGPFQDFADVMGMTKAQAVSMAAELQKLKPEDAIQRMVKQMEDAGVQGAQMSFVMKSMSNDLEYAANAFANNGKEMKALKKEFRDLNGELVINQKQAEQLAGVATNYEMLTSALGGASSVISASLAPTMNDFFNSIISVVPNATNTIVDFINTFNKAQDIQSISQIDRQMKDLANTIENGVAKGYDKMSRNMQENPLDFVRVGKYQDAVTRLAELEAQRAKLLDEQKARELELAKIRSGGTIGGGTGGKPNGSAGQTADQFAERQKQAAAYLEQLRQANLTELQLIDAQNKEKQAKLNELLNLKLITEEQYLESIYNIDETSETDRYNLKKDMLDKELQLRNEYAQYFGDVGQTEFDKINEREQMKLDMLANYREKSFLSEQQYQDKVSQLTDEYAIKRMKITGDEFGKIADNMKTSLGEASGAYKAFAIVQATIATYTGAIEAYKSAAAIPYVGFILGPVAAAATIAAGVANIAKIRSAREQGGAMVGGSAYQMAERGKAEVIVPAGSSRARTAAQMRDIMGQNSGGTQAVTIINQTTGRVDNVQTEQRSDGQLLVTISEYISDQFFDPDSKISKARRATA